MTEGERHLEAICADPEDIEARVVYADWLIESGDPRGEYIAQHCALERMTGLEDNYPALLARTHRLEAAHAAGWLADYLARAGDRQVYSRVVVDDLFNPVFRHGFLHRIAADLDQVEAQWPWLREREPIQGMQLLVGEHIPDEFYELGPPSEWRTIAVNPDGWFTDHSVGRVLGWGLAEVREMDLSKCSLGEAGCQLLANIETDLATHFDDWTAPPPLPVEQITSLVLHGCAIGDAGALVLFEAQTLAALEHLDISQCRLEETKTLEALRGSGVLSKLRSLSIAGNKAWGGQLSALAGWETLPKLRSLALPQTATADDVRALFPAASTALRSFDLSSAKPLLATPNVVTEAAETLTELDIGTTRIGDKNWPAILAAPSVRTVVDLRANGCSLSDKAIAALAESPLDRLVKLDLSSNKLTDKSLQTLAEWPGLQHVTHLRIGNNRKVTAAGYQALCEAERFAPANLDIGKSSDEATIGLLRERYGDVLRVRS